MHFHSCRGIRFAVYVSLFGRDTRVEKKSYGLNNYTGITRQNCGERAAYRRADATLAGRSIADMAGTRGQRASGCRAVGRAILALTKLQMDEALQSELSALLAQNREDSLDALGSQRFDQLMGIHRYNMVRKAETFKVATERDLVPPIVKASYRKTCCDRLLYK